MSKQFDIDQRNDDDVQNWVTIVVDLRQDQVCWLLRAKYLKNTKGLSLRKFAVAKGAKCNKKPHHLDGQNSKGKLIKPLTCRNWAWLNL